MAIVNKLKESVKQLYHKLDDELNNKVDKVNRANVTDPYDYDHNQDSVPYIYGRYGKPNGDGTYTEREGLIKTSIGGIKKEILAQITEDYNQGTITEDERDKYSNNVEYGLIPEKYRHMLDVHTIPMRDGNCAMPVGIHIYDEDKDGNIINSRIYYGAAAPTPYMRKYVSDQIKTVPTFKTVSNATFEETDVGSFDGGYLKVTNHTDEDISVGIYDEVAVTHSFPGVGDKPPISPYIYFYAPDEFVDVEWLSETTFKPKKDITGIEISWTWSYYSSGGMIDCSLLKGVTYRLSYVDRVGNPYPVDDEGLSHFEFFEHTGYITIVPENSKRTTQNISAHTTTKIYSLEPNEIVIPISCLPDINKLSFEAKYRPITWTQLFTGLKDGTKLGVYQHSEKNDKAVSLKFTDINIADKSEIAKSYDRTVTGKTAAAFGSSVAPGERAFAAGSSNVAFGGKSIALGCDNYAKADSSVTLGYANYTNAFAAIAVGHRNISIGSGSFASGTETQAIGDASFTANTGTIAGGKYSAAFGNRTQALFDNQFVVGKFNDPTKLADGDFFVVGAGSADGDRCNAFVAGRTWQGDAYVKVGDTTLTEEKIKSLGGNCVPKLFIGGINPYYNVLAVLESGAVDENGVPLDNAYRHIPVEDENIGIMSNFIVRRDSSGNIRTNTPIDDRDCANKKYVDDAIDDVNKKYVDAGFVQRVKGNGQTFQVYAINNIYDEYGDITLNVEVPGQFEDGFDYGQIPYRQENGNLLTNTPVKNLDCANKKYVDDIVGDIETLLGGI